MTTQTKETFFNKIISTKELSKKEWLVHRKSGIGGSDIGAILGVNPYRSALAVWHDKVKGSPDETENIPAELGIYLEPFMKSKFEKWLLKNEGIEAKVEKIDYILQHPENKIALANIDGHFIHPEKEGCIVEYKTTSERHYKEWEEGNLPDHNYLQTQWYLYVTNEKYCYLPFLIGNRKFDVLTIERNEEVIKKIIEVSTDFWENFVLTETPPAPDGSISAGKILDEIYNKEETGKITEFPPFGDEVELLDKYNELNESKKETEKEMETIKQKIKAEMGDSEIAVAGRHKISWKEQVRAAHWVKESKFRMFKIYSKKENGGK